MVMSTTTTDVRNLCREYSCTISSGIGQKKVSQDHILLFVWKVVSATGWPFHSELRFGVNPEIENSGQKKMDLPLGGESKSDWRKVCNQIRLR